MKKGARFIITGDNGTESGKKIISQAVATLLTNVHDLKIFNLNCERMFSDPSFTVDNIEKEIDSFIGGDVTCTNKCVVIHDFQYLQTNFSPIYRDYLEKFPNIHFVIIDGEISNVEEYICVRMFHLNFVNSPEFIQPFLLPFLWKKVLETETMGLRLIVVTGVKDDAGIQVKLNHQLVSKFYDQKAYNNLYVNVHTTFGANVNELKNFVNQESDNNGRKKSIIIDGINLIDSDFYLTVLCSIMIQYPEIDFVFVSEIASSFSFMPNAENFYFHILNWDDEETNEEHLNKIIKLLNQ